MEQQTDKSHKNVALRIAASANEDDKKAIASWIDELLEIRTAELSAAKKAKQAISVTASNGVAVKTAKIVARSIKKVAWDDRANTARAGILASAISLVIFGGQGAGIAALGTAIGVPLWVVFGAGASFLYVLYEEVTGARHKNDSREED